MEISDFTYGEKAEVGNIEPKETHESAMAVFDHMVETGKWMETQFNLVLSELNSQCTARRKDRLLLEERTNDEAPSVLGLVGSAVKDTLGEMDAKLENMAWDIDAKLEQIAKGSLELKVVKKQSPATLLVYTAVHGVPVDLEFSIEGFDVENETTSSVPFDLKRLDTGKYLLKIESNFPFFFVKATYHDGSNVLERSHLVDMM